MSKIYIVGTSVTITSDIMLLEDLKRLEKFNPDALKLVDPETKEETFRVSSKSSGISSYGISFNETDAAGRATMTQLIPGPASKRSEYVIENFGKALMNFDKVEAQIVEALCTLAQEQSRLAAAITVVDAE